MKIRLIRHATLTLNIAGKNLLVDPMLSEPGVYRSLTWGPSARKNPVVPLPCSLDELIRPDAVLVTHTHFDHFDASAARLLARTMPLYCQPSDHKKLARLGFEKIQIMSEAPIQTGSITLSGTSGKHGRGWLGSAMGKVSGFVLTAPNEPKIYIVGDSVWHPKAAEAINRHQPDIILANAGAARFNLGSPITMDVADLIALCKAAPRAKILAVHMEAVNHCRLTRAELKQGLEHASLGQRVLIPNDGETFEF